MKLDRIPKMAQHRSGSLLLKKREELLQERRIMRGQLNDKILPPLLRIVLREIKTPIGIEKPSQKSSPVRILFQKRLMDGHASLLTERESEIIIEPRRQILEMERQENALTVLTAPDRDISAEQAKDQWLDVIPIIFVIGNSVPVDSEHEMRPVLDEILIDVTVTSQDAEELTEIVRN